MKCTVDKADNGYIVEWWDEAEPESTLHRVVFQIPEGHDETKEDPPALMELLYFIKEHVLDCYYSKHKRINCMVRMEGNGEP